MNWMHSLAIANQHFRANASRSQRPVARLPGERAVITCMDPRVNLAAIGVPPFDADGAQDCGVRIIRSLGARHELRSLAVAIHLAGIREILVLMHTDCGCALAHHKCNVIADSLRSRLDAGQLGLLTAELGGLEERELRIWLRSFSDVEAAVVDEVETIRSLSLVPADVVVHGAVYELDSGEVRVVVDGHGR